MTPEPNARKPEDPPLRVAHIVDAGPDTVNGVATNAWWLANAQAQLEVPTFLYSLGDSRLDEPLAPGLTRRQFPRGGLFGASALRDWILANGDGVTVVHLHSVFIPHNAVAARACRRRGIAYLALPNGGYDGHIFRRGRLKKHVYYWLVERPMLRRAAGIVCVAPRERDDLVRLGLRNPIAIVRAAFDVERGLSTAREPGRHAVWMGRWDVAHKGLDRLIALWAQVESQVDGVELHLYGAGGDRDAVERLARSSGCRRAFLHDPVFGPRKWEVLSRAALYVHAARWEVFGISIAEALSAGVPVALSRECYIADDVRAYDCGEIVDADKPGEAAGPVAALLRDSARLRDMSLCARSLAQERYAPRVAAQALISFYASVLQRREAAALRTE